MNYGDCEYGTLGGIYGNLCPNVSRSGIPAATTGAKLFLDEEDAVALAISTLL